MATVVYTPVQAYVSTFLGNLTTGQSAYVTFSWANTGGFDAEVPVKVIFSCVNSAGPELYIVRSTDGGASYETDLIPAGAFPAGGAGASRTFLKHLILPPGQYLIAVCTGGGGTGTYSVNFAATARIITAYIGV